MRDGHVRGPESGDESSWRTAEARPRVAGAWAGYVIFALFLLFLLIFDAQAAVQREWANFTGITVFILAFAIVPTGAAKWFRRSVLGRKLFDRWG